MTYEEFKKLSPEILEKLKNLKLSQPQDAHVRIMHRRDWKAGKAKEGLYYVADLAESQKLINFAPKLKAKPKPVVDDKEAVVPLPSDKPIPIKLPLEKPVPTVLGGGDDDGEES